MGRAFDGGPRRAWRPPDDLGFEAYRTARERFLETLRIDSEIRRLERSLRPARTRPDAPDAPSPRATAPLHQPREGRYNRMG